jgi:hypothetical protein
MTNNSKLLKSLGLTVKNLMFSGNCRIGGPEPDPPGGARAALAEVQDNTLSPNSRCQTTPTHSGCSPKIETKLFACYLPVISTIISTFIFPDIWNRDRLYEIMVFGTYLYVPVCTEYILVRNAEMESCFISFFISTFQGHFVLTSTYWYVLRMYKYKLIKKQFTLNSNQA